MSMSADKVRTEINPTKERIKGMFGIFPSNDRIAMKKGRTGLVRELPFWGRFGSDNEVTVRACAGTSPRLAVPLAKSMRCGHQPARPRPPQDSRKRRDFKDREDVRMVEGRQRFGSGLEAAETIRIGGKILGRVLRATLRSRRGRTWK